MSVYSMTGYASLQTHVLPPENPAPTGDAPAAAGGYRIGLELRSVNSRFLDLSFKLGDELRTAESPLRELLTAKLKRGKVELRAFVSGSAGQGAGLSPAPELLAQLTTAQQQVLAALPLAQPLSVADVLKLSASASSSSQPTDFTAPVLALASQALTEFLASRAREGTRLATMLRERTAQLRSLTQTALPLVPTLVAAQQQRFVERFTEALKQADANGQLSVQAAQERALTEAAAFAIRIDVAEELTRLTAHLDEIDALLAGNVNPSNPKSGELGKRLDFIIQELHREANTLGSKSSTLELSRISVEMKVLIEQMREQVQNIE
ncbi:MAG: YicC/YloC family endoribonuclease [Brachymonas sp.]